MKTPAPAARNWSSRRNFFLCGYPPRDLLLRADFVDSNLAALAEAAKSIGTIPLCVGYVDQNPERPGRALRNSAAVLQNGKIVWCAHKCLLPTYDVFDEDRYFEPAKTITPLSSTATGLALRFARIFGTTRIFGRNGCIAAIPSRSSSPRAPKSLLIFPRHPGTMARSASGRKCSSVWRGTKACRWRM